MEWLWAWFILLLLFVVILGWPSWPYTKKRWPYSRGGGWRYAVSGSAAGIMAFILILFWLGIIAISIPRAAS